MPAKIEIYSSDHDEVINSYVAMGKTTYETAIYELFPLLNRFEAQRKLQDKKFYRRLQQDLVDGCIMPPITVAFINKRATDLSDPKKFEKFIDENIANGYILDGMQRLNTLKAAFDVEESELDVTRPAYINVIVAQSQDKLLYRMITLNNGQKPMTPRHQIEILTSQMFNFEKLENVSVQSEKERAHRTIRGAFNHGDISKGYLAFLTKNINNENNKIIEEKMDEILVGRMLDARPQNKDLDFEQVIYLVDRLSANQDCKTWFKVSNNFIGFCVGIHNSYDTLKEVKPDDFANAIALCDAGIATIDVAKVNLGKIRRQLSSEFISKYLELGNLDEEGVIEHFFDVTAS